MIIKEVVVNDRHPTFTRLIQEYIKYMNVLNVIYTKEALVEDCDTLITPSKFPGVEKFKYLIYLEIKYPQDRDVRNKILEKFDNDYTFYKEYLIKNAKLVVEITLSKKFREDFVEEEHKKIYKIPISFGIKEAFLKANEIIINEMYQKE